MTTYELTYIVSPEMTLEQAEAKAKEIESAVANKEGVILKQSNPVAVTLSYPIKKRASGFFGVVEFQSEPEKLVELKEIIAKDGKIVRHMLIIKEPAKPKKERRARKQEIPARQNAEAFVGEEKTKEETSAFAKASADKPEKAKIELKDIEQKLDELLGE